jgi:peptidoglycan/xylan/chitin deacetylase (PgdA/CDA1 family)
MTMSRFGRELDRGTLPPDAVAITFDDGYVDNFRNAKPRLEAAGAPATFFLAAGAIGSGTEFWWDEIARRVLGPHVTNDGGSAWRAWQEPRRAHEIAYLDVWRRLRDATPVEREAELNRLRKEAPIDPPAADDLPMIASQVAEIASSERFEIGSHTVTHPVLPLLECAERRNEILQGKQICERIVNQPIAGFAYPHGAVDADTRTAVRECGFDWACSTVSSSVPATGFDRYALPRVFVSDCDGPAFEQLLAAAGRLEAVS